VIVSETFPSSNRDVYYLIAERREIALRESGAYLGCFFSSWPRTAPASKPGVLCTFT
jgi:hypothetical protein